MYMQYALFTSTCVDKRKRNKIITRCARNFLTLYFMLTSESYLTQRAHQTGAFRPVKHTLSKIFLVLISRCGYDCTRDLDMNT